MRHLVTVIDWYGPYDFADAMRIAREEFDDGLYLCIGRQAYERGRPKIQYVGIAQKSMQTRVNNNHHKLSEVTKDRKIWLGEVGSLGSPGRRDKKTSPALDFAEWALVYFLKPLLNDKKTKSGPKRPVTVLNRWWRKDFKTPWIKRPHPDWPDLIDYLGLDHKAKVVWFRRPTRIAVPR